MRKVVIFMFCILGLIVGVIVGEQLASQSMLSWLSLGGSIGLENPIVLDLKVIEITLGFWCKINIGGLFGLVIFAVISKWITSWLKI